MKKVFFILAISFVTLFLNAQTKTYSTKDANLDGEVNIGDVNSVISEICGTASSRKVVPLDSLIVLLRSVDKTFAETIEKKLGVEDSTVTTEASVSNLLPGKFSVSATKQVQFTKSNLYWDGSNFHFEENQTDYPTTWSTSHVGHFFWTNLTDYKSGAAPYMPYAENYSYSGQSKVDKFWCGEYNKLTVDGTDSLYVLNNNEWNYLIRNRHNSARLFRTGVTITYGGTDYTNCLIIAPDDFSGELKTTYTIDELNSTGFLCLPAAGERSDKNIKSNSSSGGLWLSSPEEFSQFLAKFIYFDSHSLNFPTYSLRNNGMSIRLVRNLQ